MTLGSKAVSGKRGPPPRSTTKPVDAAIPAKVMQGLALHQQGKLAEAELAYEEILRQSPTDFDALHLPGVVAMPTRRAERAVELIKRAINLRPKSAPAHNNLGNALSDLKRFDEALTSYAKA